MVSGSGGPSGWKAPYTHLSRATPSPYLGLTDQVLSLERASLSVLGQSDGTY